MKGTCLGHGVVERGVLADGVSAVDEHDMYDSRLLSRDFSTPQTPKGFVVVHHSSDSYPFHLITHRLKPPSFRLQIRHPPLPRLLPS